MCTPQVEGVSKCVEGTAVGASTLPAFCVVTDWIEVPAETGDKTQLYMSCDGRCLYMMSWK